MTTTGVHEQQAAEFLARRDRVMANLIRRTGPFHLPRAARGHFAALAESILHQQLAGAAARAIHGRVVALFDGARPAEAADREAAGGGRSEERRVGREVRRRREARGEG